jgi:FkbM family methyltransferase
MAIKPRADNDIRASLLMTIKSRSQQFIREKRRTAPLRALAALSEKYLRHWYNEDFYEFERNGEAFALDQFAHWNRGAAVTVWDVGSHRGEWSEEALKRIPAATIHSFEVIPSIAADIPPHPRRSVHVVGLSNRAGESRITFNPSHDTMNTLNPFSFARRDPNFNGATLTSCQLTTGDLLSKQIGAPSLLKIDVEGHEVSVLRGCGAMLNSEAAPVMIQLEYGLTYLPAGESLLQIHDLLPSYSIGRLYPDHVDFRSYDLRDDHFRMGNLIAVRDGSLKALLSN